ncbi:hypothetical protein MKEN_00172700 [Mycena kentingensis (nom. inval.)]|nr:hypothetical protein MKEN_00172700 [Mycena kentingensis (nom. inval.)]
MSVSAPPTPSSALVYSSLIEALLEATFFGVYSVLFIIILYLFHSRKRRWARVVLWGLIAQFLFITGHWVTTFYQTALAFGDLGGGGAADKMYSDMKAPPFVISKALYATTSIVTNLLVVHRVYVIFARRLRIVAPSLVLLLFQLISGGALFYYVLKARKGESFVELYVLSNPWVTTSLATSILLSLYSTVMIWLKLLRVKKAAKEVALIHLQPVGGGMSVASILANIAESAALQTAVTIAMLVTYRMGFVGQVVFNGISPALLGISTVIIYARVGLGWAYGVDLGEDGSANGGHVATRISFARPVSRTTALGEADAGSEFETDVALAAYVGRNRLSK